MLRKSYIVIIAVFVLCFSACTDKQKKTSGEPVPIFIEMTKQDTTDVLNLVKQYFGYVTSGNVDEALAMLKVLEHDSIKSVPADLLAKQKNGLRMLRPIRYEIVSYLFRFEDDCVVRCKGILFEKEEGDTTPNTVSYVLRPVRHNHTWYLTLADSEDVNTINSEIPN